MKHCNMTVSVENELFTFLVCIFSVLLLNATYGSLAEEPSLFSPLSCGVRDTTRSFCNKTTGKPEYAFPTFTSLGVEFKWHLQYFQTTLRLLMLFPWLNWKQFWLQILTWVLLCFLRQCTYNFPSYKIITVLWLKKHVK